MATWSDLAWRARVQSEEADHVQRRFARRRLMGWLVLGAREERDRAEFMVLVATRTLLDPVIDRQGLLISLEREGPLGGPSPSGRWGVEPGLVRSASPLA